MATRVNSASITGRAAAASAVATIPAGTGIQAGDVIFVCASSNGTHVLNGQTCKDSVNGTNFTQLKEQQAGGGSAYYQQTFVFQTPGAIADGSTITLTGYAAATSCALSVDIFRGYTATVDQAAVGTTNATGTTAAGPALGAAATAGALVLTTCSTGATGTTQAAGSPYTAGSTQAVAPGTGIGYLLAAPGGSTEGSTWTLGVTSVTATQTVSFLPAAAASAPLPAPPAAPVPPGLLSPMAFRLQGRTVVPPTDLPAGTYGVIQRGIGGTTGATLGRPTIAGTTLIVYTINNTGTPPVVNLTGSTTAPMTLGFWNPGYNSIFDGIHYVLNNPGGITGFTTSGINACYYREVAGIPPNPQIFWNWTGNATAVSAFTEPLPGAVAAGDFSTAVMGNSPGNPGTAYADGWTDTQWMYNFAQTSYTTGTAGGSGTLGTAATFSVAVLTFKQIDQAGPWRAIGSVTSQFITAGQASFTIPVTTPGSLLVFYTKTNSATISVSGVSGAGTTWTRALSDYADTGTPVHIQNAWIARAAPGFTGSQVLTVTYSAAIGATAVEHNFQEFYTGQPALYSVDSAPAGRANGAATFHTWPQLGPMATSQGELFVGYGRVGAGAPPYRTPSAPAVVQTGANSNPFLYALNLVGPTWQPQLWDTASVVSYTSGFTVIFTVPVTPPAFGDSLTLQPVFPPPSIRTDSVITPPALVTPVSFPQTAGPKMETLADTFPGTSLNLGLWNSFGTVAVNNGLTITDTANSTNYSGINSNARYDLTGSYLLAQLTSAGTQLASTQALISIVIDASNSAQLMVNNGSLLAQTQVATSYVVQGSIAYSATTMKWLRIREAGGTMYFDYSADASSWSNLTSLANPWSVRSLTASVQQGAYTTSDPQTSSTWANLNTGSVSATVTPAALAVSAAFPAATVRAGSAVTPAALAVSASFPAPVLHTDERLTATALAVSSSFPALAITAQSNATITPGTLAASASFAASAVSTGSTVTPAVLATASNFPALTIRAGAVVTPAVLAVSTSFPAPAVSAGTVVTPAALAVSASFPAPAVSTSSTVTTTVLATSASFGAPGVNAGAGVTTTVLAVSTGFAAPLIDRITAGPLAVSAGFSAPAVDPVTPALLAATASFPAVTISAGTGASITTTVLATSAVFPALTITAQTNATAAPGVLATATSFPSPSISAGAVVTPVSLAAPVSFPGPSVQAGSGATVTPAVLAVSVSFPAPAVSTGETVIPGTLAAAASFPAPAFRADQKLTPPALAVSASFAAPALRADAIIAPSSLAVSAAFPGPSVQAGSGATIVPASLAAVAGFPAPAVNQGQAAAPGMLAVVASFPAPVIRADQITHPAALGTPVSFPALTIGAGASAAPAALAAAASFPAPVVSQGQAAIAGPLAVSASFPAPAVSGSSAVTPAFLHGTVSFPAPAIAQGSAAAVPVLAVAASFPAPAVSCGATITPPVLAVAATFTTPGVQTAGNASVTPGALITSASFPPPVVGQGAVIAPARLATATAFPAVTANAGATVTPASLHGTVSFPAALVVIPATVTPPALVTTASFPARTVTGGATAATGPLAVSASFPAPGIHCSSTVTPPALTVAAAFPAPLIQAPTNATVALGTLSVPAAFPAPAVGGGATVPLGTLSLGTVFLPLSFSAGTSVTPPVLRTLVMFVPPFMAVINTARAEIAFTATASMRVYAASGPDLDRLWREYQTLAAVAQADANLWAEARIAGAGSGMTGAYFSDLWESDGAAQRAWHAWQEASQDWNRQLHQFAQYGEEPEEPVYGGVS